VAISTIGASASARPSYYPVAVDGGLFSVRDSHVAQGDSEICGTAIEMSLTGTFQLVLHKKDTLSGSLAALNYPLLETQDDWVLHGFSFANYLQELGRRRSKKSIKNPQSS
jgi:acetamidase/formamidase